MPHRGGPGTTEPGLARSFTASTGCGFLPTTTGREGPWSGHARPLGGWVPSSWGGCRPTPRRRGCAVSGLSSWSRSVLVAVVRDVRAAAGACRGSRGWVAVGMGWVLAGAPSSGVCCARAAVPVEVSPRCRSSGCQGAAAGACRDGGGGCRRDGRELPAGAAVGRPGRMAVGMGRVPAYATSSRAGPAAIPVEASSRRRSAGCQEGSGGGLSGAAGVGACRGGRDGWPSGWRACLSGGAAAGACRDGRGGCRRDGRAGRLSGGGDGGYGGP